LFRKAALAGLGVVLALLGLGRFVYDPAPVESVAAVCTGEVRELKPGEAFTVLVWNLQFGASRKHKFFYDGGDAVHVPREDVDQTLDAIARVLDLVDADLVLLQEVDRSSARTHGIDQLSRLAGDWPCRLSTPYHRAAYVPHPPGDHLGRVNMNLAVLSRFPLQMGSRIDLPRLVEPWIRRVFNLKRALLAVEIPVEGELPLRVGNTHLSAFSRGDGTLGRQVDVLERWVGSGRRFLLGGDFNLLPPGDDAARLDGGSESYADSNNPLAALLPAHAEVSGEGLLEPAWRTYLPFGAEQPDRKIDYVFHGQDLEVLEARVLAEHDAISDHLPIFVRLKIKEAPGT
jgi:endonuclease/exonuclease/phosphatase family metal-dependent hydrolase